MKTLAAFSLCGMMLFALPAQAQAQNDAANGCWGAVTREARAMLDADRVSRTSYSLARLTNAETLVTGVGQADGRPFTYRCTYNDRNGRAYAVSLSPEGRGTGRPDLGGGPGRGPGGPGFTPDRPINTGDARRAAEQSCYDAALNYAQRQNPTASNFKIFLSQNRFSQQGREEIRVTGQGELRQINRQRFTWGYNCTYNARNGRVRDVGLFDFIPNR